MHLWPEMAHTVWTIRTFLMTVEAVYCVVRRALRTRFGLLSAQPLGCLGSSLSDPAYYWPTLLAPGAVGRRSLCTSGPRWLIRSGQLNPPCEAVRAHIAFAVAGDEPGDHAHPAHMMPFGTRERPVEASFLF
jgi:hypothetical protein